MRKNEKKKKNFITYNIFGVKEKKSDFDCIYKHIISIISINSNSFQQLIFTTLRVIVTDFPS